MIVRMAQTENATGMVASTEEIQKEWHELKLKVEQLEADRSALEKESKSLRHLLERVIEHRQKSHGELVLLLTGLVSKLQINEVGALVARLVEHNAHMNEVLTALGKGNIGADLPQPAILKALEQKKRELAAALKPAAEELIRLDTSLDAGMFQSIIAQPELFFSPGVVRANRCFIKGHVPKERIVKEFGAEALVFFNDVTTDPKLNPNPKPEEIALAFKSDFEAWFQQNPALLPDKRGQLLALYQKIQRGRADTEPARSQKNTFIRLTFILELLHFYENQNTEAPDVLFAQRLPGLIEQLVITGPQDNLDEKLIVQAEGLMAFVVNPDHRQTIVNNVGKIGGIAKTLKYVFQLRAEKVPELDGVVAEFVKHLIPPKRPPQPQTLAAVLRLIKPDMQRLVVHGIIDFEKLGRELAEVLGKAVGKELGLTGLAAPKKAPENISAEVERQMAWEKIRELITQRVEPAAIAVAMRNRLHEKYDADELKQSWITLIEVEPLSLIRIFCQIPYLPDGKTDSMARLVMESYVSRLMHEKYAVTYGKVMGSLKNMFKANPNAPTLLNFLSLVKWVDAEAAKKLSMDIGMPVTAQ